ncbi:hypothetical protein RM780_17530 [Streptomyces sp. DSM 44917]|uniref:Uncharacterized protein n=1 Tax=Streptomyces boetiae TaxID=3075541 RepID=A0ABU2LB04_9ACTN|nr:hypothetical protein [Streptomyces sp. DSM 44917]MDT0308749.1 hypothetical protein [Streptomyces sp. DSM 44917]
MTTTDPLDFVSRHRDTIFRWLGILAALLVAFLILRHLAMRLGGWRAAWQRARREAALTAHAFAAPFRAWLRHRRSLRVLVRGLRAHVTWRDAERALAAAREAAAPAGGRPYAALVGADTVTVLLAGGDAHPPEEGPWWRDEDEGPGHWTAERAALPPVVPVPDRPPAVLVALGESRGRCAFLDLAVGPPLLSVEGDRRGRVALHQAVAAQLDARLPEGLVVVAEGVHRAFPGLPVRAAYRTARELRPRLGVAPVLVTAELPDPLPPELAASPSESGGTRTVLLGPGRGYTRTLLTDRHGQVAVAGTPLLVSGNALGRALARVLASLPPVLPPVPPGAGHSFAEPEEDELDRAEEDALDQVVPAGPQFAEDGVEEAPPVRAPAPVPPPALAPARPISQERP